MSGRKIMRKKIMYCVIRGATVNTAMRNGFSKEETATDWGHRNYFMAWVTLLRPALIDAGMFRAVTPATFAETIILLRMCANCS